MNKKEYFGQAFVTEFCEWFGQQLEATELAHTWEDRRFRKIVQFQHMNDAYSQYSWPFHLCLPDQPSFEGRSFDDNHKALTVLQIGLRKAVAKKDDGDTLRWAHAILRWGGVFSRNGMWLSENRQGVAEYFAGRAALLGNNEDDIVLTDIFERFNSGMTKIYSLLVDDFIIYDSRVAAALGWVVVKFCRDRSLQEVPDGLRFPWAPAKEAPNVQRPKRRNPSEGNLRFPRLRHGTEYARWNLRASWLLSEVVRITDTAFAELDDPLRALEAALFMIGYDLGHPVSDEIAIQHLVIETAEMDDDGTFSLCTRGNGTKFRYEHADSYIVMTNENGRIERFETYKVEEILTSLYRQFGNDWFLLANNVEKLGKGTEIPGLGRTILDAYPGNTTQAQTASYFGPIMEDLGLFEWNGKAHGIAWRLTCEPRIQLPELDD
ncbi:MAG: hypothetical protein PHY54_09305 [Methylococcales bacterium]|nr:hypothetical protein [Methylococcales bacterium]